MPIRGSRVRLSLRFSLTCTTVINKHETTIHQAITREYAPAPRHCERLSRYSSLVPFTRCKNAFNTVQSSRRVTPFGLNTINLNPSGYGRPPRYWCTRVDGEGRSPLTLLSDSTCADVDVVTLLPRLRPILTIQRAPTTSRSHQPASSLIAIKLSKTGHTV